MPGEAERCEKVLQRMKEYKGAGIPGAAAEVVEDGSADRGHPAERGGEYRCAGLCGGAYLPGDDDRGNRQAGV